MTVLYEDLEYIVRLDNPDGTQVTVRFDTMQDPAQGIHHVDARRIDAIACENGHIYTVHDRRLALT